jgi:tetratricopeptide (TPR) repeat protein
MRTSTSLKRGLDRVLALRREQRFDLALQDVTRLMELWPDHPRLLVLRAELIQLQGDEEGLPTLDDAKNDLKRAVALDPFSADALIELGYFLYAVEDDAKAAAKYFEKVVHLCVEQFTQALVGHAEALSELGQETKAASSLMEACSLAAHYRGSVRENVLERIKDLMEDTLQAETSTGNGSQR